MSDLLTDIRGLLELGWPAIVLMLLFIVESDRRRRIDEHIRDLRAIVFAQHPDLEDWQPPTGAILPARREVAVPREPRTPVTADYNLNLLSLFHLRGVPDHVSVA
jgi:hypothetical protein